LTGFNKRFIIINEDDNCYQLKSYIYYDYVLTTLFCIYHTFDTDILNTLNPKIFLYYLLALQT
ncbi:hypothetical protein, partial [Clostridium sp. CAG:221]|uniref:hypothetical protein n=1 Tax=Clostridium sp. CAG:221 TaxID=1262780 RepID=UPI0026728F7C